MDKIQQNIYKTIFAFNNKLNSVLGKKIPQLISIALVCGISLLWILQPYLKLDRIGYLTMFIGIIVTILTVEAKPRKIIIRKSLLIPLLLLGLCYFVSALLYHDRFRFVVGFYFILIIPFIVLLLSNKKNRGNFLFSFSIGSIISFVIFIVLSLIYAPLTDERYSSILLNPNGLVFVLLPITISILYMLEKAKKYTAKIIWYFVLLFLFGVNIAFILYARSRTGLLSVILMFIFLIIYWTITKKKILIQLISLLLAILICIPLSYFMLTDINSHILDLRRMTSPRITVFFSMNYKVIESNDILIAQKNTTNLNVVMKNIQKRSTVGISDDSDISSGRYRIWESFSNSINWKGHDSQDGIWISKKNPNSNDPHNMFLKIGYDLGIGGMISMMIFSLIFLIYIFKKLLFYFKARQMEEDELFFYLTSISFFIVAMLSTTFLPFTSILPTIFWCTVPIIREMNHEV